MVEDGYDDGSKNEEPGIGVLACSKGSMRQMSHPVTVMQQLPGYPHVIVLVRNLVVIFVLLSLASSIT